jgi:mRNA interferase RelE/StbE
MYEIEFRKQVIRFIDKRTPKDKTRITNIFLKLKENPYRSDLDIKKLEGRPNVYRLRIGKYRFLYKIIKDRLLIFVQKADTRGDIYKEG